MFINKQRDIFFAFVIVALSGCNGSSEQSDNGGGSISHAAPIANSFVRRISTNYDNDVDFSNYVYDDDLDSIKIDADIISGSCSIENKANNIYSASSNKDELCVMRYNVSNSHGLTSSQKDVGLLSVSSIGVSQYPPLANYSATRGTPLEIDVFSDLLGEDSSLDLSNKLINEVFTTGVGETKIDSSKTKLTFNGTDFGVASILYTIVDKDSSDLVGYGRIDVAVSSSFNSQPIAEHVLYSDIIKSNTEYLVDLESFSPSIISDPDGDELQIIDFKSYEGKFRVDASDALNLSNKKFYVTFPNSSSNVQDVSYTVTDHNGGYATNIIRFRIESPSSILYWRDIFYKNYKRFMAPLTIELLNPFYPSITDSNSEDIEPGPDPAKKTVNVAIADHITASSYCSSKGARLPRVQEFKNLFSLKGNLYESDRWPRNKNYWLDNGESFNIVDGSVNSIADTDKIYFSCIRGGLESFSIIKDNSYSDGNEKNEIDFQLKDVYGAPFSNELIAFKAKDSSGSDASNIKFVKDVDFTDTLGVVKSIFSSTKQGSFAISGQYIDDLLTASTSFKAVPKYSLKILSESDSCIYGQCRPMKYGLASTTDNIAYVTVKVTDNIGSNVENVTVNIKPKDTSADNGIRFSNGSSAGTPVWGTEASCQTQNTGQCRLQVALSKSGLLKAEFVVSISGKSKEDYMNYSNILGPDEGTFDNQRDITGQILGRERQCSIYGKTVDGSSLPNRIHTNTSFVPALEDLSKPYDPNFDCLAGQDRDDLDLPPVMLRKACRAISSVLFKPDDKACEAKEQFYENAPEARSTFAKTGSGSKTDGTEKALALFIHEYDYMSVFTGFNYKTDPSTFPDKPHLTVNVNFDLYNIGKTYTGGGYCMDSRSVFVFKVGIYNRATDTTPIAESTYKFQPGKPGYFEKEWRNVSLQFDFQKSAVYGRRPMIRFYGYAEKAYSASTAGALLIDNVSMQWSN
ncbi:hypothetical protein [Photobacterium damselae]|uniref:hypothetical protein n=1 Tax=Photobacterium damselae TaxID=38293 RepID=UPI0040685AFD